MHATEVALPALEAFIEGALVEGKAGQLAKVEVAFRDDPAFLVIILLLSLLDRHPHDFELEVEFCEKLVRKNRHSVVDHDFLLAARAVEVAEGDTESGKAMGEELQDAVGMEDMSTSEAHTGLSIKLGCEADAAEIVASGEQVLRLLTLRLDAR